MSDKLSPKPEPETGKHGWHELDDWLKKNFTGRHSSNTGFIYFSTDKYVMSQNEIIDELKSNNCEVKIVDDSTLGIR